MMRFLRYIFVAGAAAVLGRRFLSRGEAAGTAPQVNGAVWRQRLIAIGGFVALLAVSGVLVIVTGIMPIKASSGHWGITKAFLDFAKQRSVATHSIGIEAPALDDDALVLRGAGHYETGCRPCHGAPELPRPVVVRQMTAEPPDLIPRIADRKPRHLFYIVKHGIKFTGMPAWPSERRDDEVWAMVAFLQRLPGMTMGEYLGLATGSATDPADSPISDLQRPQGAAGGGAEYIAASCARCHGTDGRGRGAGAFPRLDGQSPTYLFAALRAYARGDRHSGIMRPVAAALSVAEMRALALYYAGLSGGVDASKGEALETRDAEQAEDAPAGDASDAPAEDAPAEDAPAGDALEAPAGDASEASAGDALEAPAGDASEVQAGEGTLTGGAGDASAHESIARGADIARRGVPDQGVPSCRDCHGPSPSPRNPFYPTLDGQYRNYMVLQLELFRDGHRGGSSYAHLMELVAGRLTPEQMQDVARYYESLKAERR